MDSEKVPHDLEQALCKFDQEREIALEQDIDEHCKIRGFTRAQFFELKGWSYWFDKDWDERRKALIQEYELRKMFMMFEEP